MISIDLKALWLMPKCDAGRAEERKHMLVENESIQPLLYK